MSVPTFAWDSHSELDTANPLATAPALEIQREVLGWRGPWVHPQCFCQCQSEVAYNTMLPGSIDLQPTMHSGGMFQS